MDSRGLGVSWFNKTKIIRLGSDRKQWMWKQVGEGLIERKIQSIVRSDGGNIMVWGCMGWDCGTTCRS